MTDYIKLQKMIKMFNQWKQECVYNMLKSQERIKAEVLMIGGEKVDLIR
jgi:hypothetical protein